MSKLVIFKLKDYILNLKYVNLGLIHSLLKVSVYTFVALLIIIY